MNHSVQAAKKRKKMRKGTVRDKEDPGSNLQGPDIRKSRFLLIEKEGIPMYQDEKHPMMTI
ncbi:MAG: hypothetical protein IKT57_03980 [Clostridia bacterium]|nr:hypothetical protein [Clostridia bacterium]